MLSIHQGQWNETSIMCIVNTSHEECSYAMHDAIFPSNACDNYHSK